MRYLVLLFFATLFIHGGCKKKDETWIVKYTANSVGGIDTWIRYDDYSASRITYITGYWDTTFQITNDNVIAEIQSSSQNGAVCTISIYINGVLKDSRTCTKDPDPNDCSAIARYYEHV